MGRRRDSDIRYVKLFISVLILSVSPSADALNLNTSRCAFAFADLVYFRAAQLENQVPQMIRQSPIFNEAESRALQLRADEVFRSKLSEAEKIDRTSKLYFNARIEKLSIEHQAKARQVLKNIESGKTSYARGNQIFIEEGLDPSLIDWHRVAAHEFQHIVQHLTEKQQSSILRLARRLLSMKPHSAESKGELRLRWEVEAIGAQYDIIKLFPPEKVQAEARTKPFSIRENSGGVGVADFHDTFILEAALTMSREDYIEAVRSSHGYQGLWAARLDVGEITKILKSVATFSAINAAAFTGAYLVDKFEN